MRKFLLAPLSLVMVFLMCLVAFATDSSSLHAPDLNDPDRLEQVNSKKVEIESAQEMSENARVVYPVIRRGSVDVPLWQQQEYNFCGPACVQMVLDAFDINVNQYLLAEQLETAAPDGTFVYMIRNCLNSYLGAGTYQYYLTSEIPFSSGLENSINDGYPVVCHTETAYLPVYNGHSSGHYVVAKGYFYQQNSPNGMYDEQTVYYNDPNKNAQYFGSYGCTYAQMTSAINGNYGYYIMGG